MTYRAVWGTVATLTVLFAAFSGGLTLGWPAVLGTSGLLAMVGAVVGLGLSFGAGQGRVIGRTAAAFGVGGVLLLGLPPAIGSWAVPVILCLAVTSPPVVRPAMRAYRRRSPEPTTPSASQLSARELGRRWRRTTYELQREIAPARVLRIVQEREALLTEIERRDPELFARWLVRAGWRSEGSVQTERGE